jgi:predicted transcriptional regulator
VHVLLSIRPQHVENILEGRKTFEFRRKLFMRKDIKTVLIYCTMPVGRLVAEFDIANILSDDPESLWDRTSSGSGISKCYFDAYFEGRSRAHAIQIGDLRIYPEPIMPADIIPDFTPPQSYRYVPSGRGDAQLSLF